jgi:response regulator RpfG family c-di-GMP phosphodiesterase
MYSTRSDGLYYTRLYDLTSTWDKIKLIVLNVIYYKYYEANNVFLFDEVYSNIENLTSFMIDAVVVSYVKNGELESSVLSYKDNVVLDDKQTNNTKFIYVIVVTSSGKEYDFTKEFNNHINDVVDSPLKLRDFVYIFNEKYEKNLIDENDIKLKVMMDNDFTEILLNSNDQLII